MRWPTCAPFIRLSSQQTNNPSGINPQSSSLLLLSPSQFFPDLERLLHHPSTTNQPTCILLIPLTVSRQQQQQRQHLFRKMPRMLNLSPDRGTYCVLMHGRRYPASTCYMPPPNTQDTFHLGRGQVGRKGDNIHRSRGLHHGTSQYKFQS